MLILGLAEQHDPLARLLASPPFVFVKPLALGAYTMQVPVVIALKQLSLIKDGHPTVVPLTFLVLPSLLLVAYLAQTFVQDPVAKMISRLLEEPQALPTSSKLDGRAPV